MRSLRFLAVLALAAGSTAAAPPRARHETGAARSGERHLLLVLDVAAPPGRITHLKVVRGPAPDRKLQRGGWEVLVEDAAGAVLHRGWIPAAGRVRGEFAGPSGKIEAVSVPDPSAAVRVRVPVIAGAATLRIVGAPERGAAAVEIARVPWPEVGP